MADWPDYNFNFEVQNQRFRLYGGAQYSRLLNEFEFVSHSREFQMPSVNEVASALGAQKSHNVPSFETAVNIFLLLFYFYYLSLNLFIYYFSFPGYKYCANQI